MPPTWAYQIENFDPSPDEELVCSICHAVFCDPVQSPCNHVFCRNCITKWLENSRSCPICRRRTPRYAVERVVPLISNIIMKLTLRCHNQERGCEEKFSLENCEAHVKECIYEIIVCKNKPCQEMILRRDIKDHETNNCAYRYVRCRKCGLKFTTHIPQTHNCIRSLRQRLKRKNKKIKELQATIEDLKAARPYLSETSSNDSTTSDVDIMIELGDLPNTSSSFSRDSSNSPSDHFDSDTEDQASVRIATSDILYGLEMRQRLNNSMAASYLESSVEYPRSSTPGAPEEINFDMDSPLEEPQTRRPAKRRLLVYNVDSSEEENDDLESLSLPSSKRIWQAPNRDGGETSSRTRPDQESHSSASQDGQSDDTIEIPSFEESFTRRTANSFRQIIERLRGNLDTAESEASPFQRTIDLLEQYSLESDTEWLPTRDARSVSDYSDLSESNLSSDADDHPAVDLFSRVG